MLACLDRIERIERKINRWLPEKQNDTLGHVDCDVFLRRMSFAADPWQRDGLLYAVTEPSGRMILNCSRQAGKSTISSLIAVYLALYRAPWLTLIVSPTLRQSSELFRKVSEWLKRLRVRPEMDEDNKLSCMLKNGSRIISLPGTEANVRGYSGVNLIIVDEASRVRDEMYFAIRPMLAVSKGTLMLMSTPFGKRGFFHDAWENGGEVWKRLDVPATKIARISPEFLEEEKRALGKLWFEQEYMGKFIDPVDSVFQYDLIEKSFSGEIKGLFEDAPSPVMPLFEGGI